MNPLDLSVSQLKRAATIKQRIEALNRELRSILGGAGESRSLPKKKRTMSAAVKKRIATAQRARWAKLKGSTTTKAAGKKATTATAKAR